MPGTIIGPGDAVVNKVDRISDFVESKIQWGVR